MNNDLISREVLKKALEERCSESWDGALDFDQIKEVIDNAPTVEQFDDTELQRAIGYADGYSKGREERPKGEWIKADIVTFGSGYDWVYKCSVFDGRSEGATKFCPYCGADMRESNDRR